MKLKSYVFVLVIWLSLCAVPMLLAADSLSITTNSTLEEHLYDEHAIASHSVYATDLSLQSSKVYTWTYDTRTDWEEKGWLDMLDEETIPGSLQLIQKQFDKNSPVNSREFRAAEHLYPSIAVDNAGNTYAVWMENYDSYYYNLYFAYRPAGGDWGADEKVNDINSVIYRSASPDIAVDGNGNTYVLWTDSRDGRNVYFAYRSSDGIWSANIKVNDSWGEAYFPSLAVDDVGNAFAVWSDKRNGNVDIYFAYRPWSGSWSVNTKINDDASIAPQVYADIAVDANGNAYTIWVDRRNDPLCDSSCDDDIYFAYRPADGIWSTNVRVNDDHSDASQSDPALAVDPSGNVYAVWADGRDGDRSIYFAYRPKNSDWDRNILVSSDYSGGHPAIAVDLNGNAYLAYYFRFSGFYFAYRPVGESWGESVEISNKGVSSDFPPSLAIDANNNAYLVLTEYRDVNNDIYFYYRPAGGSWEVKHRVNGNCMLAQSAPALTTDQQSTTYALWRVFNLCNSSYELYFAYRKLDGMWQGHSKINAVVSHSYWKNSIADITVDGNGNVYAIWEDERNDNSDIYFAYRPAQGDWDTSVKINDDASTASQSSPAIAVDAAGNAYAVWADMRNGNSDIYFAYRPAGGNWQTNTMVNDDVGSTAQSAPDIATDESGNAYIVWHDERDGDRNVYFAHRSTAGIWSANTKVNDDIGTAAQASPSIAVDESSMVYAVWADDRNGDSDIYFAYRPVDGSWSANIKVNDDTNTSTQSSPAIAVNEIDGHIYTVWSDSRNSQGFSFNVDIYFARRPIGNTGAWEGDIKVNDDPNVTFYNSQISPAVVPIGENGAQIVWIDERNGADNLYSTKSFYEPIYAPKGTYKSVPLNTNVFAAEWSAFNYSATISSGSTLTFETRSHTIRNAWSAWEPISGTTILSPSGQYFQYRVRFATTVTDTTPSLDWVQITYIASGTPSAPRFATPCGVTNQVSPTLKGMAAADTILHLYINGAKVTTTTVGYDGTFTVIPTLISGSHTITAVAENTYGTSPTSAPLSIIVNPTLSYDPINVRGGQWSKDGWLLSPPRDAGGCATPVGWRVWPRENERFRVQVPVSYTTTAAVTVTLGTQTITLTEHADQVFAGVFHPPIEEGDFSIVIETDGKIVNIDGGPVLIDPDGFVYKASATIDDTISGAQVTCYYSDTHSAQWVVWDAWNYDNQINPQITLEDGYFSFYTPAGTYRVVAEKEGYPTYTSPDLIVVSKPVRHNIPLGISEVCTTPLTEADIVGPLDVTSTMYIDNLYTFQAIITPTDATLPISYTWSPAPAKGQNTDRADYTWSTPGLYTVTLTVENCGGVITRTLIRAVEEQPGTCAMPLTDTNIVGPLDVTGTLYVNMSYTFQAIITPSNATLPITYTWMPAPASEQGTNKAVYRWTNPDTYTITLTAENCGGSTVKSRKFIVEEFLMHKVYLPLVFRN